MIQKFLQLQNRKQDETLNQGDEEKLVHELVEIGANRAKEELKAEIKSKEQSKIYKWLQVQAQRKRETLKEIEADQIRQIDAENDSFKSEGIDSQDDEV